MTEQEFFKKLGIETTFTKSILSGYQILDELIGGGFSSEIVTIASRPAHGKTSLLINLMMNFSMKQEFKGIVAFPRLTEKEIIFHISSWLLDTDIFMRELTDEIFQKIYSNYKLLTSRRVTVINRILSFEEIFTLAEAKKADYIILDDYFRSYRWQFDFEKYSEDFEKIKEFNERTKIPIFISILTTKSCEKRPGNLKPQLGDIYRSDLISTYSHKVIQLYRPTEYGFSENEDGFTTSGQLELLLQQNSKGKTGGIRLFHHPPRRIHEDQTGNNPTEFGFLHKPKLFF